MSLFSWLIQKIGTISVYLPTKRISKWSHETWKSGGADTGEGRLWIWTPAGRRRNIIYSTRQDQLTFYSLISSNLPDVMRYFEEREMKRMWRWARCNSMHEFRLPPSRVWYVFGCESEASDLTPDKCSCAAASECITEPTARAKSIFIWVQLMSLQLLTKVPPSRRQMWGFFFLFLSSREDLCVCMWLCACRCVCFIRQKVNRFPREGFRGGRGLKTAQSCL